VTRKALALAVLAALIALVGGSGRALASGGTYSITAGGDQDWGPSSGALNQTESDKVEATGTMVATTDPAGSGAAGTVDYHLASGPGIVRASANGVFSVPSGLAYPFNPSTQAVATTELTVSGPSGEITTSLNVHVDGTLETPVCSSRPSCGVL
jgi:hypothetical protein